MSNFLFTRAQRFAAIALLLIAVTPTFAQPLDDPDLERAARAIHEDILTLDSHIDIPVDYATAAVDPAGFTTLKSDLPKMRAGGLDAAFLIVYTPQGALTADSLKEARKIAETRLAAINRLAAAYPDQVALATTPKEARDIVKSGRRAILIGMENAFPLQDKPNAVDDWASRGVRYMGITHFGHNQFGDSSNPKPELGDSDVRWSGLSPRGRDLIFELNKAGIMIDVSHAAKATMMQAVAQSVAPIIASHSGVSAVAQSPRNLDDEQLRALRDNGGVVQIVAYDLYLKALTPEQIAFRDRVRKELRLVTPKQRAAASKEKTARYRERLKGLWAIAPRATVADLVDHIDHAVRIAGIDHVGVASDFDGGGGVVGWEDASETLNVTRELVRRGYSAREIEKIWGGNLLRVFDEVLETADKLD
ncbi:MAG: dipeptidase [Pseudomonadota bacterium]